MDTSLVARYFMDRGVQYCLSDNIAQGRRNGSGRPGGCRTNNSTSKNFYLHIISIFENVCRF